MAVGLKEIAKQLKVSVMTVSRAINNHPEISAKTRQRVLREARRLNYRPNQLARALVTRKSMAIGLVVPDIAFSFFSQIARGAQKVAAEHKYDLLLFSTDEDPELELDGIQSLLQRRVDGMLIASCLKSKEVDALQELREIPHIFIDRKVGNRNSYIVCDDCEIGVLATEHLIKLGYRKIAHLGGPNVSTAEERFKGYRKTLEAYGLPFREDLVWRTGFFEENGYEAARQVLAQRKHFEALFCVNDPVAIGVLRRCQEEGVRIPADLALVGVADLRVSSVLRVPLTTVYQPKEELGEKAANMLFSLMRDPNQIHRVVLKPKLVVRESCGAKLHRTSKRVRAFRNSAGRACIF